MSVGQLGLVARLTLTYEGAGPDVPPSLMVKLPSTDGGSRAVGVALGISESEVRFYQEIAPTVGIRVPRPYWAEIESSTGRFTLLLEDLSAVGEPGDMIAGGTPDQAARALEASSNARRRAGRIRLCPRRIGWRTPAAIRASSPRWSRPYRCFSIDSLIALTPKTWSSSSRSCPTRTRGRPA